MLRRLATFQALQLVKQSNARVITKIQTATVASSEHPVTVQVQASSVNLIDSRMLVGKLRPFATKYPFVPGCDFAGVVTDSKSDKFPIGSKVVGAGDGLGTQIWGGYASVVHCPESCLSILPPTMSTLTAATIGYTGLVSALAVLSLGSVQGHQIVVAGGETSYGLLSCLLLSKLGAEVLSITKDLECSELMTKYGAGHVLDGANYLLLTPQHISKAKWSGFIDCYGGDYTGRLVEDMKAGSTGVVLDHQGDLGDLARVSLRALTGRNVTLKGLNASLMTDKYSDAWSLLYNKLPELQPTSIISLEQLSSVAPLVLSGKIKERVVVKI